MKTIAGIAAAGIVSLLATTLVSATPIMEGTVILDRSLTFNPIQIFEIETEGFENLTLAFSAIGGGTIDPCDGNAYQDCLSISTDETAVMSGLSIAREWQDYGPFSLVVTDSSFDLIFNARISAFDENMTINWQLHADQIPANNSLDVLAVAEPGLIALLSLGLIGFGMARRRSA